MQTSDSGGSLNYIPELDGLRGLAIGIVLLGHTMQHYVPGGFIGVDVFFVLSGYLITTILLREFTRTKSIHLGHFYARRVLRLVPALLAMLAAYSVLMVIAKRGALSDQFVHEHALAVIAAGSYLMNWTYAFDLAPVGYLVHTWSLGVEEQFYIMWPILLAALLRLWGGVRPPGNLCSLSFSP